MTYSIISLEEYANKHRRNLFKSSLTKIEKEIFVEFENDRYGDKYTEKPYKIVSGSTISFDFFEQNG